MDPVDKTTLETLRRQHHSLYPVYKLHLPAPQVLASQDAQQWLVGNVLDDRSIRNVRPEEGYERRFWRRVVHALEEGVEELHKRGIQDAEVDTRFYERLTELMVSRTDRADDLPGQSYRTFVYDLAGGDAEKRLTLLEEQMAIQGGTTGLRTWTASLHLGHHILAQPEIIFPPFSRSRCAPGGPSNHTSSFSAGSLPLITELGAGTGFLSILLAQLEVNVMATDLGDTSDEHWRQTPLTRLRSNVKLNGMEGRVCVSHLDWMDSLKSETERPDIWQEAKGRTVVAADVIYDPELVPALVKTLRALVPGSNPDSGAQAIVAATVRQKSTIQLFERECSQAGMVVERLDLDPIDPARSFWDSGMDEGTDVWIMRVTMRGDG